MPMRWNVLTWFEWSLLSNPSSNYPRRWSLVCTRLGLHDRRSSPSTVVLLDRFERDLRNWSMHTESDRRSLDRMLWLGQSIVLGSSWHFRRRRTRKSLSRTPVRIHWHWRHSLAQRPRIPGLVRRDLVLGLGIDTFVDFRSRRKCSTREFHRRVKWRSLPMERRDRSSVDHWDLDPHPVQWLDRWSAERDCSRSHRMCNYSWRSVSDRWYRWCSARRSSIDEDSVDQNHGHAIQSDRRKSILDRTDETISSRRHSVESFPSRTIDAVQPLIQPKKRSRGHTLAFKWRRTDFAVVARVLVVHIDESDG